MPLICVVLSEKSMESNVEIGNCLDCDVLEVRLDQIDGTFDTSLLEEIEKPVIATCMPKWEGGKYSALETERMEILRCCLEHVDYVTIEYKTGNDLRDGLVQESKEKKVKVIMACHDFNKTPEKKEIISNLKNIQQAGADIAKVAYMPNTVSDAISVIDAQVSCQLDIPVIALAMGQEGRFTRFLSPMLGGYLTYVSPTADKKAAGGQYTLSEMRQIRDLLWR